MDGFTPDKETASQPTNEGDHIHVGIIQHAQAIAIGAGATAVYQGLTVEDVAVLVAKLKRVDQPKVWDGRIPYLGLQAFRESDAQFFFGRESLVDDLLERVQKANFITIAGPSGSGKSSVARAGLFHALSRGHLPKSDGWPLVTMQPRGEPLGQLSAAIERLTHKPGSGDHIRHNGLTNPLALHEQIQTLLSDDPDERFVLLVDQFEEAFTQTKNQASREAFIQLLTAATQAKGSRTIILIALRSDFISHCALYPDLRALISQQFQLVGAMDATDLAKAITLPALEVGVEIDRALVSRIVADMKGEPGALPLMSFALRDLFEIEKTKQGEPMALSLSGYLERGGIESALERHANQVFAHFSIEQQELAKSIFSKLVEVGQGGADTRRIAILSELIPAGHNSEDVTRIIDTLAREGARLLTISSRHDADIAIPAESTVTIAHEKLIDAWPWLRHLVDENREAIALQNQVALDAQAWSVEKDVGYLYRGGRLLQVEEKMALLQPNLDVISQNFIQASQNHRQREIEQEEARRHRELEQERALADEQRKRADEAEMAAEKLRHRRNIALALAAGALLFGIIAVIMFQQAKAESSRANRQTDITSARLLSAQAQINNDKSDPVLRTLLAVEGLRRLEAVEEAYLFQSTQTLLNAMDLLPRKMLEIRVPEVAIDLQFTPDNQQLVVLGNLGAIYVIDRQTTKILDELQHPEPGLRLTISPDGQFLGVRGTQFITVWRLSDKELVHTFELPREQFFIDNTNIMIFSPDNRKLVAIGENGSVHLWALDTNNHIALGNPEHVNDITFSPDSRYLLIGGDSGVQLWDLTIQSPTLVTSLTTSGTRQVNFGPNGHQIVLNNTQTVEVWDAYLTNMLHTFSSSTNGFISDIALSTDGQYLVFGSAEAIGTHAVEVANLLTGTVTTLATHDVMVQSVDFRPSDSNLVLSTGWDGLARISSLTGSHEIVRVVHQSIVKADAFSSDGQWVATVDEDGTIFIWTPEAGAELRQLKVGVWASLIELSDDKQWLITENQLKNGKLSIKVWHTATGDIEHEFTVVSNPTLFWDGQYAANLENLASVDNGIITVYQLKTGNLVTEIFREGAYSVSLSPDNQYLAALASLQSNPEDTIVQVWSLQSGEMIFSALHPDATNLQFSPNSSYLLVADGRNAIVWEIESGAKILEQPTSFNPIFSPDGDHLAFTREAFIEMWHLPSKDVQSIFAASIVNFSPDGRLIALNEGNGDVTIRPTDSVDTVLATIPYHRGAWESAFSADGQLIAIAHGDQFAQVWDISINPITLIAEVEQDGFISSVDISEDGHWLITASAEDGTVKIWAITPEEIVNNACSRLPRNFTEEEWVYYLDSEPYGSTCDWDT